MLIVLSVPGNTRAEGRKNPSYSTTFVFDNDFAALQANTPILDETRLEQSSLQASRVDNDRTKIDHLEAGSEDNVRL